MVSFSAAGGSVGAHMDSYHVFLVQGEGRRRWSVGNAPVQNEAYIEGLDLKILEGGVDGEAVEVSKGDVIYIPPHFAHEGVTVEAALTFSVGFLGPRLSELFVEYGYYLEQIEQRNERYSGAGLNEKSAGVRIAPDALEAVRGGLMEALQGDDFAAWLAVYFSAPTHDDVENMVLREESVSPDIVLERLRAGEVLYRSEHVKLAIASSQDHVLQLAAYGDLVPTSDAHHAMIEWIGAHRDLSFGDAQSLGELGDVLEVATYLYNQNILFFEADDRDEGVN